MPQHVTQEAAITYTVNKTEVTPLKHLDNNTHNRDACMKWINPNNYTVAHRIEHVCVTQSAES